MNDKKINKQISFQEEEKLCETYSKEVSIEFNSASSINSSLLQEYDRGPDLDCDQREEEQLAQIENLQIIVSSAKVKDLQSLQIVDFHIMLESLEGDEEPACDFGVFISHNHLEYGMKTGDVVISIDDEDCLEKTAAQVHHSLNKLNTESTVTVTLGKLKDNQMDILIYFTAGRKENGR